MKIDVHIRTITNNETGNYSCMTEEESKKAIECLQKNKTSIEDYSDMLITIEYGKSYTMHDLLNDIRLYIGLSEYDEELVDPLTIMIRADTFLMEFCNSSIKLKDFVARFHKKIIDAYLLIINGYGDFLRKDGFRFFMPSHEGNRHNKPHVHVETKDFREGTIDILTLKKLAGKIKPGEEKRIQEILKGKQRELIEAWNLRTDGINVDVDYLLGQKEILK